MIAAIYWLIALAAYCFFTYHAALAGGVKKAFVKTSGNDFQPWFILWLICGAAWVVSVPGWIAIRVAENKRKELKDD